MGGQRAVGTRLKEGAQVRSWGISASEGKWVRVIKCHGTEDKWVRKVRKETTSMSHCRLTFKRSEIISQSHWRFYICLVEEAEKVQFSPKVTVRLEDEGSAIKGRKYTLAVRRSSNMNSTNSC